MFRDRTRIWYDLTMSLTYPSILGAIIYFFFDASIQVYILPLLEKVILWFNSGFIPTTESPAYSFFQAFGLTNNAGFLAFLFITLLVMVHYSVDYLYSKYSEAQYGFRNFLWDTIISLFLAIAYIVLSKGASQSLQQAKLAFIVFWFSLAFTYLIFLWWDAKAYLGLRTINTDYAQFYLGMIRWFEISGIFMFMIFAFLPLLITRANWFAYTYVVASIFVLGAFSWRFCSKVSALERLSRENEPLGSTKGSDTEASPTGKTFVVRQMEVSDITECTKIFVDAYQEVYSEPWTEETGNSRLLELYQCAPDYCFILKISEAIVGFVCARPFSWHDGKRVWIEEVVVEKQLRGKGFGKLLIHTLLNKCQSMNVAGVSLLSAKGSIAFKFYKKMKLHPSDWMHLQTDLENLEFYD